MKSLFVELQTEELPPKALKKLSEAFAAGVEKSLAAQSLLTEKSAVKVFGAPRRMGVRITEVLEKSPDTAFEQRLVPVRVGLDADGNPTPALTKKMAALGITASVADLKRVNDGKNEQLVYEGVRAGVAVKDALQKTLEESVKNLPIPKVMNYQLADGETTVQFVRPVKHLTALYGEDVVDLEMFGLKAGRVTMGHRFESAGEIEIPSADAYEDTMRSVGHVVADYAERRAMLVAGLEEAAAKAGGTLIAPEDLIDEANSLTEWPVIYVSEFEEKFLDVPEECLILTMQTNQKYFPMRRTFTRPTAARRSFRATPAWCAPVWPTPSSSTVRTACRPSQAAFRVLRTWSTTTSSAARANACCASRRSRTPWPKKSAPIPSRPSAPPNLPRPTFAP